jgi:putative hydrolase of the HAD superfamily
LHLRRPKSVVLKKYRHLFFDLDGTLWDLQRNTHEAMLILFREFQLPEAKFDAFFRRYHYHNDKVWALYRDGKMDKETLRTIRFERAMADVALDGVPVLAFADRFLEVCPAQPHLLPDAKDVLDYCKSRYALHIITNGFVEVQGIKMRAAGIDGYFEHIIFSEDAGVRKPHRGIFELAVHKAGAQIEQSLMIGDDWEADILGARDFGMDQVFLTSTESMMATMSDAHTDHPVRHNYHATHTIAQLNELLSIV